MIKVSLLRRTWSQDVGSTLIQFTLLRPWIERIKMIFQRGGFELAANSVDRNSRKSAVALDQWKLLSSVRFLQILTTYFIDQRADQPLVSI